MRLDVTTSMNKKLRNPYANAMALRYWKTSKVMKDKRLGRGGARNKKRDILRDAE